MIPLYLSLLFVSIFIYYLFSQRKKYEHFPPGPPSLPIFGCVPFLPFRAGARNLMASVDWIPKYGDVIGLRFGKQNLVFIQDFEKAKEMVLDDRFTGRVHDSHFVNHVRGINGKPIGIITTEGSIWKTLRRFSLTNLKDFGFGKQSMEVIIQEEVDKLLDTFVTDQDVLIKFPFNTSILNIIWRMLAGKRFETHDQTLFKMFENLNETLENAFIELMFPYLFKILPSKLMGYDVHVQHANEVKHMIGQTIAEHKLTFQSIDFPRDFIDVYLDKSRQDPETFTENHLIGICLDFFEAGGETVGSTLNWVLLYLSLYPKEQKKCQEEIDAIGGKVTLADRKKLPLTEAFIWEVQRLSCVAPAGLEHRATEDIAFHGYVIPKDTMVYYNIFRFHMDPEVWTDPKSFRPARFLDHDLKTEKKEQFIPFGFGKRVCMGETLAKAELWLFVTSILQRFNVTLPRMNPVPDPKDDIAGLTRSPRAFHVCFVARK